MTVTDKRVVGTIGITAILVIAAVVLWDDSPSVTDSLSNTDNTPSQSVYVGHMACAECHAEIHASHEATPHSRTLVVAGDSNIASEFCSRKIFAGESYGEYEYICDEEGLMVGMPDRFSGRMFPLDLAFGSGEHAVTFLTLLPEGSETVAVEHRMSWFREAKEPGITPGQSVESPSRDVDFFGKVFRGDDMHRCVSCHVTTGKIADGEIEDFVPGIHCERCHGPGSAHVAAAESGDNPLAASLIRHGWKADSEVAMCGECHRMPNDVTAERLERYPDSLVRFQPIGLLQSRCFTESGNRLSCTTCHDPHEDVHSRSATVQVETCQGCHSSPQQVPCAAGHADDCIRCHMQRKELVAGIFFHDHWIRVPDADSAKDASDQETASGSISGLP